jgi:DNA-binding transcriptional LysR family regulator
MLELRRLRALRELAAAGSFSRAAKALGYTQSAISQQIATLERETGLQLVQRGTRPVALTEAGQTLLDSAAPIFGHITRAEAIVGELAGLRARQLRLAAFPSACSTILPPAIAAVRGRHPDTNVTLVEAEPDDAARLLKAGEVDLAVAYTYPALDDPDDAALEQTTLFDEPLLLVLPKGHRLLSRRSLSLCHLATEPWIVPPALGPSNTYRLMLMAACRDAGFEPHIAFEIEDTRAGQALVAEGLGVALIPALALEPVTHSVLTRKLTRGRLLRRIVSRRLGGPSPPAAASMQHALEGTLMVSARAGVRGEKHASS